MIEIFSGDFRELSQDLADDSIDLVLTDPPYAKEFLPHWEDLGRLAARVLKPGKLLVSYSGVICFPVAFDALRRHLDYYTVGGLNHPGQNNHIWHYGILQGMKPILFFIKPPMQPNKEHWFNNLVTSPMASKNHHRWGQSVKPFRYLIERLTEPGDLVLDPFLGGGTTAVACLQTNRRCIGYEIDPDTADIARRRVERERLFVAKPEPVQLSIDAIGLPRCKFCGAILESNGGPGRKREYCDDNCRLRAFRFRQRQDETKLVIA